jgi:hypothetical protein
MSSISKEECGILFNLFDAYASKGVFLIIEYESVFNVYNKIKTHLDKSQDDVDDLELDNTSILHLRNILKLCSQRTGTDIDSWATILPIYKKVNEMVQPVSSKIGGKET